MIYNILILKTFEYYNVVNLEVIFFTLLRVRFHCLLGVVVGCLMTFLNYFCKIFFVN